MSAQLMRASPRYGLVLSVVSLVGCFNWDFLKGQPCANSKECEPLTCNDGVCDDGDDGDDGNDDQTAGCTPRVLFFLDSSGSMAMDLTYMPDAASPHTRCEWDKCEDDEAGPLQSRINAARHAIHEVAHAHAEAVDFALMTYQSAAPPTALGSAPIPQPCQALFDKGSLLEGESYRFTWVKNVNQPHSDEWNPATNVFGTQGMWVLCGDNRPFPYLRHDDLGGFSMPDDSQEPLPDTPLYLAEADITAYRDPQNYSRKVQWFPRFMGRRVNLDCSDPLQVAIAGNTVGDYDSGESALANVCGRDFYYWPYVDGNPGYSAHDGLSDDPMEHTECDANGANCQTKTDQVHHLGIARREPGGKATLYAPFYSEAALLDDVPDADKGPMSRADAWLMFDGITSKSYAGGADVGGDTPLASSVGDPSNSPENLTVWANAPFSHDTITSYVFFLRRVEPAATCQPLTIIMIMDGQPDPWFNEGGSKLYERLRMLRVQWDVEIHVVAFTEGSYSDPARIHEIACAASGADSVEAPCSEGNIFGWDTCADPNDPSHGCAWLAADPEQLQSNIEAIMAKVVAPSR
jgi:hypothetical protein